MERFADLLTSPSSIHTQPEEDCKGSNSVRVQNKYLANNNSVCLHLGFFGDILCVFWGILVRDHQLNIWFEEYILHVLVLPRGIVLFMSLHTFTSMKGVN